MSAPAITRIGRMGRWKPGARERLVGAALELFAEDGFEQTTVAGIAQRAGVTERTFFRHFTDKREVLFEGSATLQATVVDAIASAPPDLTPLEVVAGAYEAIGPFFADRLPFARRRAAAIAANTSLQERELLKLATLGAASAAALRERGVPEPAATLAAEIGVTVFSVGFRKWIGGQDDDVTKCIRETFDELDTLTA